MERKETSTKNNINIYMVQLNLRPLARIFHDSIFYLYPSKNIH